MELLAELTKVAFAESTPMAYDLTLYELSRATLRGPEVEALEALVRAAMRAPDALPGDELSWLPSFTDAELSARVTKYIIEVLLLLLLILICIFKRLDSPIIVTS